MKRMKKYLMDFLYCFLSFDKQFSQPLNLYWYPLFCSPWRVGCLDSCAFQNKNKQCNEFSIWHPGPLCGFTFQIVNVVALENQLGSTTHLIWLEFPPTVRGITFFICKCKIICKCLPGLTANQIYQNHSSQYARGTRLCWMVESSVSERNKST